MVREGIYQIFYGGSAYRVHGVFVFRNGLFTGVGPMSAIYEGGYWPDQEPGKIVFDGCVRFPPDIELVTGQRVGPEGLTVPFRAVGPPPNPRSDFVLMLQGEPVELSMNFIAPLPG